MDSLYYPSIQHFGESLEGWAFRRKRLRQIQRLERDAYLERLPGGRADRIYRLTPKGRLTALGGRDPESLWNRKWDGKWRLVLFDIPSSPSNLRQQLTSTLREQGLGCLQRSVWISPDPLKDIRRRLKGMRHPASLTLFEGKTIQGEKPQEIVQTAWPFEKIISAWIQFDRLLEEGSSILEAEGGKAGDRFASWSLREQVAWRDLQHLDPFLPRDLLPRAYGGLKIWKQRLRFWKKVNI